MESSYREITERRQGRPTAASGDEMSRLSPESRLSISVVITAYERQGMLAEAIKSVERQSVPPDEIVVVDDGSKPPIRASSDVVKVVVVRQENAGLAAARNLGFLHSSGDIVFFLDDDDVYEPGRIARAIKIHTRYAIVVCGQGSFTSLSAPRIAGSPERDEPERCEARVASIPDLLNATTPSFGAMSIRRNDFLPLNESFPASQDIDWWIRMVSTGLQVAVTPGDDLCVRVHGGARHTNGPRARLDASRRLLSEHSEFFGGHRRARSFRLARASLLATKCGEPRHAFKSAMGSLVSAPTRPGFYALLSVFGAQVGRTMRNIRR